MSWSSSPRDNWERLVAAVLKKEQIWQLCHQDSVTTIASEYSQGTLSFPSNSLRPVSLSPSPQLPFTKDSGFEDRKHASGSIKQKLFSSLLWNRKPKNDLGRVLACYAEDHFGLESFSLRTLREATDQFSQRNVLGRGGHGTVYKGRLGDGSLIAVKRLRQQAIVIELEMANCLAHRNVVRLRGFCIAQKEQLLVYPYMANGSVLSCLRDRQETQPPLDLAVRKTIALGVANGLSYLHHECNRVIIHNDIKAANILLDEDFEAVVADFNLAKFIDCCDDDVDTTVRLGTVGYMAPEYLSIGKFSVKNDVYGYGVFLLELITGCRVFDIAQVANDNSMLCMDWVKRLLEEKAIEVMVDRDLGGNYVEQEVEELLQIALICTQMEAEDRPSMLEVVRMLEDAGRCDIVGERWEELLENIAFEKTEWIIDSPLMGAEELSGPR